MQCSYGARSVQSYKHDVLISQGIEFKDVPPSKIHMKRSRCLLLLSPTCCKNNRNDMHILCKKRLFRALGFTLKEFLTAKSFCYRILLIQTYGPPMTATMNLWVMANWITVPLLVSVCCVCLHALWNIGYECAIEGDLCHCWAFTSWQLVAWWVKNNPAFSNFVIFCDCFFCLFLILCVSPWNAQGH